MRASVQGLPVIVVLLVAAVFAGCIGSDEDPRQDAQDEEDDGFVVRPPPDKVGGLLLHGSVDLGNANELTLRGDYAYLSGNSGSFIVDVSDPKYPELVAQIECTGVHVRTVELEERLLMTISSQADDNCDAAAKSGGLRLVDVTDSWNPVVGPQLELPFGSHTHTQYNDTGIVYNSAYNLPTRFTEHENLEQHMRAEIIDVSDWQDPQIVEEFVFPSESTSIGCHDIWPEPHRDRAVCAAIDETQIWDVSDPLAPEVVSIIRNPSISIHHSATTTEDGETLIIGDEWTGALGPGCFDGGIAPIGALWFYDVSDPMDPQLQGWFAPPHYGPDIPCTAHNFNIVEGHDVVVAGFFRAGVALVDFSDPTSPEKIDDIHPEGGNVWAAYYHNGYVFTGDTVRGLDVLKITDYPVGACEEAWDLECLLPNP